MGSGIPPVKILLKGNAPLSFSVVIDRHEARIQINDRIAPRQVTVGPLGIRTLNAPGDDLPSVAGFQNFPFGAVGPILPLLQQPFGRRDLIVVTALRFLWLRHSRTGTAAAA